MGVAGLQAALAHGEPLCEFTVLFRPGVDAVAATAAINAACNDFDLYPKPWYDIPQNRVGSATRGALERLFGVRLVRVQLVQHHTAAGTWGYGPNAWRWEQIGGPDLSCSEWGGLVESVGLSQPGEGDDGQPWG